MKKVIYTCLTGGYDKLQQPLVVDPSFDYICFTERDGKDGVWNLRKIPVISSAAPSVISSAVERSPRSEATTKITLARYPKLQPHEVLAEYDWSVYMDANLQIAGEEFYRIVDDAIAKATPLAMLPHPSRDSVWEELRYCYLKDKLSTGAALRHHRYLKSMGMPRHWGLWENNVILRSHNSSEIIALDNLWWQNYNVCCTRDQLTFAPSLYRCGITPALLFGEGRCARNVEFVNYINHPATGNENTPGKLTWGNIRYRLRLWWRQLVLLILR